MWIDLSWILGLWLYGVGAAALVTGILWLFGKDWDNSRTWTNF